MRGLIACVTFGLLFSMQGFTEQQMVYESITKGDSVKAFWSLDTKEDKISASLKKRDKKVLMELAPDFTLIDYNEKIGDARELSISKVGSCLIVKNYEKGKDKILSHKIDKKPWVQEFTLGLKKFILSDKKTLDFCIVYPKDLALHDMIATKEEEEVLSIAGKKYDTQKVKITLTGLKKKFWKAYGWFDKNDGLLVQYKANEGPATPYTETSLIECSLEK